VAVSGCWVYRKRINAAGDFYFDVGYWVFEVWESVEATPIETDARRLVHYLNGGSDT
jgi:hypothetical protein